ncbi:MAG: type IV pilus modification PilV family protein, partial [Planctomycetota bacterium]
MNSTKARRTSGLTLIEVVVAILVIAIGVLGAIGYRYWCALDARRADVQITAARLGSALLESWKAGGGFAPSEPENNYDPEDLAFEPEVTISASGTGPGGFNDVFGNYLIVANRANYYATLSYQDAAGEPRCLNVAVAWMPRN